MYSHFQDRTKENDNIVFQEERPSLRSCIIANKFEETRTQTQNILKRKTNLKTSSKEIMHQQAINSKILNYLFCYFKNFFFYSLIIITPRISFSF